MTNTEKVRGLTLKGLSPKQIQEKIPDLSLGYIYKVRSEMKKGNPNALRTTLQKKIGSMKYKFPPQEIAERLGCSRQYVYKVVKEQCNGEKPVLNNIYRKNDEYYSPLYAVKPIEKYLKRNSIIWCPFDTDESLYVRYFKAQGHTVVNTHIDYGQDFFKTEPPEGCDYIISNPPFSKKTPIFQRLFELGIPFAMLIETDRLFSVKKRFNVFKDGIQQMVFSGRISYLRDYSETETDGIAPFESGYICKGILPKDFVFEEIDKSEVTL